MIPAFVNTKTTGAEVRRTKKTGGAEAPPVRSFQGAGSVSVLRPHLRRLERRKNMKALLLSLSLLGALLGLGTFAAKHSSQATPASPVQAVSPR